MTEENTKIIIVQGPTPTLGIVSFIFGLISIFVFSIILVPLALIFAILSFIKDDQSIWAVVGIICAVIGTVTSPLLLLYLALLFS